MKKLLLILPLVFLLCFTFGCQKAEEVAEEPVVDVEADIAAIKALLDTYMSNLAAGDLDGWISITTDNGIAMPPNEPIVKGKDAIRQWAQPFFDLFKAEESIFVNEIEVLGNWAFARLTLVFKGVPKAGGEAIQENGKALWIFKQQDHGSWKCTHSIWNSNEPLPPPPKEE